MGNSAVIKKGNNIVGKIGSTIYAKERNEAKPPTSERLLPADSTGPKVPGDTLHPENLLTQVQKVNRLPRVTEELQRKRKSHSLSGEGNPILGVARDNAQRVANEPKACSEKHGDSADTDRMVAKAYACIDTCDASILVAKARIDELARRD